ncbi:hypothetical protein DH09_18285 [Bacillaceae bacterium JMAK1]|nr:hypothetical protein DH09_18285 [Bacillaceae bacterium JMAK1]
MLYAEPKVSAREWRIIAKTLVNGRTQQVDTKLTYYDGVKQTVTGKVIDCNNTDQVVIIDDGDRFHIIPYRHIMLAALTVNEE